MTAGTYTDRFKDRVLLVTGAAASVQGGLMGFGGNTVWRFFEEGGTGALITDVRDEAGMRAAEQMRSAGFQASYLRLDVTEESGWQQAVSSVSAEFGRLDYLVNIAGIQDTTAIDETPVDRWQAVMDVTNRAMFLGVQYCSREMKKTGGGGIVNLSSMAGRWASPYGAAYAASRAGMAHFTRAAAIQYASWGIRVNCVQPGWVKTPFTRWLFSDEKLRRYRADRVPLGRWGEPAEIAAAILFLLSDDASYITGSELLVDGGATAGFYPPASSD